MSGRIGAVSTAGRGTCSSLSASFTNGRADMAAKEIQKKKGAAATAVPGEQAKKNVEQFPFAFV